MNKLYLRIPASHIATWPDDAIPYALCSKDGAVLREGRSTLTELSGDISKSRVVLLIAATDVTLLRITTPPVSEAKLKSALPNLIEDQLVSDFSDSVLLLGSKSNNPENVNKRVVAVAQRSWLQQLSTTLFSLGASHVRAYPAQLCIPFETNQCHAYLEEYEQDLSTNIALRFEADHGVGVLLRSEHNVQECISTITLLSPPGSVLLELPAELMDRYKTVIEANQQWVERIAIRQSSWLKTIEATRTAGFNLMAGLNAAQANRIQWQIWRWPLLLAMLLLVVNIVGLNSDYWSLKREARTLNIGMAQTYKVSFPKEPAVPFPLEQMKKKLQMARRNSGQAASYDFTVLLTRFGAAWNSIGAQQLPKIASIEYKDAALMVQTKGEVSQETLQPALLANGLGLKKINAETWQIKSDE